MTFSDLSALWRGARARSDAWSGDQREELRLSALMASVYAIVGVQLPYFPIWLGARGFSPTEIAAILAAPPAIRIVSTLLSARFSDRSGRHGEMLLVHLFGAALAFAVIGSAHGFGQILAAVCLLAYAQGPINSLADGMILAATQRRSAEGRGTLHFSSVRGFGSVAILAVTLGGGLIAGALPSDALIWLLACVALVAALSALVAVRGLESVSRANHRPRPEKLARPWLVGAVVAAAALILTSHALILGFASLHWKAQGLGETFVSLAWVAGLVTEVAFFLLAGRWFGGERNAALHLALGGAAAIARWLYMATDPGALGVLVAQALHGLSCAAVQLGPAYLLARLAGPSRLAQAQGWLAVSYAAGLSLTTLACGPLYTRYGEASYLFMAAMAAVGLALAVVVMRRMGAGGDGAGCIPPQARVQAAEEALSG
jgi:MFS transporter, PPP family, 3-phenylpropionic acid transporter